MKRKMGVGTSRTRKSALAPLWLALFIQASKTAHTPRGLHKCTYVETGGHVNRAMKKLPLRAKHMY